MNIRVILFEWDNKQELHDRHTELQDFSAILGLRLLKAANDHYGNIFVVQLPQDDVLACQLINAILAFCYIKGHSWEFAPDDYPMLD